MDEAPHENSHNPDTAGQETNYFRSSPGQNNRDNREHRQQPCPGPREHQSQSQYGRSCKTPPLPAFDDENHRQQNHEQRSSDVGVFEQPSDPQASQSHRLEHHPEGQDHRRSHQDDQARLGVRFTSSPGHYPQPPGHNPYRNRLPRSKRCGSRQSRRHDTPRYKAKGHRLL